MNLSAPFISRPVMTILVMAALSFFGVLSYRSLPMTDLPSVEFPTISVSVTYPGADPQTISNNVVFILERAFAGIPGIKTITSTSYTGSASIALTFQLDKSVDLAAPDVLAAINSVSAQLPHDLPYAPTYSKVNPTATPIMYLAFTSPTMSLGDLYDWGDVVFGRRISMVEGVAQASTYGSPYAVRVQLDPQKLAAKGMGIDEAAVAIQQANVYLPTGTLFGEKKEFSINASGQVTKAAGYETLILKNSDGAIVRLSDVGKAMDSLQNDKTYLRYTTAEKTLPCIVLAIQKQAGSNTLAVIERINALLPILEKELPGSVEMHKIFDESEYIKESIIDVKMTLLIALALVVIVIFVYLGKLLNTIIPAIAIPLAILGTFSVMFIMDYTIDILSLLAITLSIGFLVDDAIVVLENIVRHVEKGEKPLEAAYNGSKEISVTILSMTLSLTCVFVPFIFMQGVIGRILHEFAITIVSAVLISGFISLSLTPLLCSKFIPPLRERATKNKMERFSEALNQKLINFYTKTLEKVLKKKKTTLFLGFVSLIAAIFLFLTLPKDFIPNDDIGFIEGFTQMQDGTSPFLMGPYQDKINQLVQSDSSVESVVSVAAISQDNQGIFFARLKPISQRPPIDKVLSSLNAKVRDLPGIQSFLRSYPLINLEVGTSSSKGDYQYTLQSLDEKLLYKAAADMERKLQAEKGFAKVTTNLEIQQPQLQIEILRDRASMLGVSANAIETVLSLAFANGNLSPINEAKNQYYVILEVLPSFYKDPSQLSQLYVRSSSNKLVPLNQVIAMKESLGPLTINHMNGLPSVTLSFNLDNIPLSTAINTLDATAKDTLPAEVFGFVQGTADIFKASFANMTFLLLITFFIIYIILGILYESFLPPLTVMSTLPPAVLGGLLTLMALGSTLSLYAFVGVIMLLGIVMKNGIILVDFANDAMKNENKTPDEAIRYACKARFRPILMTTLSAMMGAVPIAFGLGGLTAQSRRPLGYVIVGGLIFSQILTLYLTPVIFLYIEKLRSKKVDQI